MTASAPRLRLPLASCDEHVEGAPLQVGELAKEVGRSVRAIHLYEELGLLKPSARSKGRFRLFDADAVMRVRWIAKLQDLGLSLGEIQTIIRNIDESASAPSAMKLLRETYREKLAATAAQIARLRALESELSMSLSYLETCDTCDPARLMHACSSCDLHDCRPAPELVAGVHAGPRNGPHLVTQPEKS